MAKPRANHADQLGVEVDACIAALAESVAACSVDRIEPVIRRFATFVRVSGQADRLADIAADLAGDFVRSRLTSGLPASAATMHDRRSSIRLLFQVARRLGFAAGDPTLDLSLPPRTASTSRPLADEEIELCRDVALWTLASRRMAAVWALAEATGRGAELAVVTKRDVDLDHGRVWLQGGKRTLARWGELTEWGVRVLRGRLGEVGEDSSLVYSGEGRGIAGQVSTCSAISRILLRAGLVGEPDVRPVSVATWAARRRFDESGDIVEVARMLGLHSLDQASRLIGHDWKH